MKPKRPFNVTLITLLVLLMTVSNIVRLVQVILNWQYLFGLLHNTSVYLSLSALIWSLAGIVIFIALWFGIPWAPKVTRVAALVFSFHYWLEYSFLVNHTGRQSNWLFIFFVNSLLILWFYWVLSRKASKVYFGVNNE